MNPDDLSRVFQKVAPSAPSPSGWLDAARRRRRRSQAMVGMAAAMAAVAVIVPLAINLGGDAPTVIASPAPPPTTSAPTNRESDPPPTGFTEPSASATESPQVPVSDAAMEASYAQEALLLAHPDIFSGLGFADNSQVAVLYFKLSEEARAKQLAAALADNPVSRLESRRNSWTDLLSQRRAVRDAAMAAGVTVVDSAPDMLADGVVLIVPADEVDEAGHLTVEAGESLTRRLRDLGMVAVEADPRPAPVEIVGFKTRNELPGGRFRGLPSAAVSMTADTLSGLTARYPGVFTQVGLGRWSDEVDLWFKDSRRADVDRLLGEAAVDTSIVNLIPSKLSSQEMEAMMRSVVPGLPSLPPAGRINSMSPSAEFGGLMIGVEDPHELERLTPAQLKELRDVGVVAVEQSGPAQLDFGPADDGGGLGDKPITRPTVAPTDQ